MLRELVTHFSGARLRCAGCGAAMRPLRLRGVVVDLCVGCGGLWLDAGELTRMSGGRYDEVGAAGQPSTSAPPTTVMTLDTTGATGSIGTAGGGSARLVLGRGHSVVVFDALAPLDDRVLAEVFARTDGLTSIDAEQLARGGGCVVVEGVTPAGAAGLVALLAERGVVAHVIGEAALRLPPPVVVQRIDVDGPPPHRSLVAAYGVGPPLPFATQAVRVVVAARLPAEGGRGTSRAVVDVVLGGPRAPLGETRRLRWHIDDGDAPSPALALLTSSRAPSPRRVDGVPGAWPLMRPRELDRLLAWASWRASR
jgi:hypothetical protein